LSWCSFDCIFQSRHHHASASRRTRRKHTPNGLIILIILITLIRLIVLILLITQASIEAASTGRNPAAASAVQHAESVPYVADEEEWLNEYCALAEQGCLDE
jgi:hypothetical protein